MRGKLRLNEVGVETPLRRFRGAILEQLPRRQLPESHSKVLYGPTDRSKLGVSVEQEEKQYCLESMKDVW